MLFQRNQNGEAGESGKSKPAFAVAASQITLPKGGGAIRGIGEKFGVDTTTGTGSLTIPIAASPGRSGFGPQLSLSYDSGSGNGAFGFGCQLDTPSITRKTDKGLPRYRDAEESDAFVLSGAEDLVPILDGNLKPVVTHRIVNRTVYDVFQYRPRIEGLFARTERWTSDKGETHWRSITRDNVTTLYGFDENSRIEDRPNNTNDPIRVFSYLICRTFDDKGNIAVYSYKPETARDIDTAQAHEANRLDADRCRQRYLKSIRYGNVQPYFSDWSETEDKGALPEEWHFELIFDYRDHSRTSPVPVADQLWKIRPDPFSSYRAGFEIRTYRRCTRVLVSHHFPNERGIGNDCLVRSTDFTYSDKSTPADPNIPSIPSCNL